MTVSSLRGLGALCDSAVSVRSLRRRCTVHTMEWNNDAELFALLTSTLYTPVIGDVLDTAGYRHQFLPQPIHPLREDMRIAGRAMPVQLADVAGPQDPPFGSLIEA